MGQDPVISMNRNDTSMLPSSLVSRAVSLDTEICWPAAYAADVVCILSENNQVILGAEAWDLTDLSGPLVLDATHYIAEDYLAMPQLTIDKCKELALNFISQVPPVSNLYFQIEWEDLKDFIRRRE